MRIPDTYRGSLRYEKLPSSYDPDLDMTDRIERFIVKEIREKGPRQIFILAETWEGIRSFSLPSVPEELIDRTLEWFYDLEITRILKAGILSPDANPNHAMKLQEDTYGQNQSNEDF